MKAQILFSVIIPTHNRAQLVKVAVDSALNQTYPTFEIIVIDDGSTDETGDVLSSYDDPRLQVIRQKNHGVSHARNHGLKIASGNYLAFLDSDDKFVPEKLERTAAYINEFPDVPIFHTEETWYRNGKLLNQKEKHKKPDGNVYANALPICCISISTAVIKREVFDMIGSFDETLEACEDYDLWLRATNKFQIKLIPEYLTIKDGGRPDQLSSSVWGLDRFRIKALEKMLLSGELSKERYALTLAELEKKCKIFATGCEKHGKSDIAAGYRTLPDKLKQL